MDAKVPKRGRRTKVGSGLLADPDLPLQDARLPRPASRRVHVGRAAPPACGPPREHGHPSARNLRSRRRRRAKAESAPERHPAARREACRQGLRGPAAAPPRRPPAPSPDAQGPAQALRPQNGCRQPRHVTPLCLSGARTPRAPGPRGQGRRVAREEASPGRGGRGSRPGAPG